MSTLEDSTKKTHEEAISQVRKRYEYDENEQSLSYGLGIRHLQSFIIFFTLCISYVARAHLSATIVAMTDIPAIRNVTIQDDGQNLTNVNVLEAKENITDTYLNAKNRSDVNITIDAFKQVINENLYDATSNSEFDSKNNSIVNVKINTRTTANEDNIQDSDKNNTLIDLNSKLEKTINATDTHLIANFDLQNNYDGNKTTDIEEEVKDRWYNTTNDTISNKQENDNIWSVYRVYAWQKPTQEMVLGSFFLGYIIMMSPIGLVCQRWGGKLPLQISLFSTAIITFMTPWLAVWGDYKAVCLSRVAIGLTQAGTYPGIQTLVAKWVPACERGRLGTYIYTGSMIGSIMAYHISGFLSVSRFGWPSVFWVTGILCFVMGLLVTWIVTPSPQRNHFISTEEKNFILGSVKHEPEKRYATPWKQIMTSKPVWACFFAHVGSSTSFLFLFSQIPSYLHHAIGINIKNSGLLSSLPYLANFITSIFMGMGSDYMTNRKIISIKLVRIISNSMSTFGPALAFFLLSFTSDAALAVTCLVFCMGSAAGTHTGWMLNYIDLSPNFSGTLMATGNTLMNISALLLPVIVSNIVTDMTNVYQWRIVFFIVGIVSVVCNVVFVTLMSADLQPWNEAEYQITEQQDPDDVEEKSDENTFKK